MGLPSTLPSMSDNHCAIDSGVLAAIECLVPEGGTMLELGGGDGTAALVERYMGHSVEDLKLEARYF